jgi:hypothetical protein
VYAVIVESPSIWMVTVPVVLEVLLLDAELDVDEELAELLTEELDDDDALGFDDPPFESSPPPHALKNRAITLADSSRDTRFMLVS